MDLDLSQFNVSIQPRLPSSMEIRFDNEEPTTAANTLMKKRQNFDFELVLHR